MIKKYDYLVCTETLYDNNNIQMYIKSKKYQFYGINSINEYFMVPEKGTAQFKYHRIPEFSFINYFCSIKEYRKRKLKKLSQ